MQYVHIKGTDLSPSAVVMGSMDTSTGGREEIFRMLDIYRDAGGNTIDSANVYGKFGPRATNEWDAVIGEWMRLRGCRSRFVTVTKGGHPPTDNPAQPRLRRQEVLADLEESLAAMRVDCIDLYFLHRDDPDTPVGEIAEYLNEFVKAGKVRYFGCSNWTAKRIAALQDYATAHGLQGFCANQVMWNLAIPDMARYPWPGCVHMDREARDLHADTGLAAFAYESQARGFFHKQHSGDRLSDSVAALYDGPQSRERLRRALVLAEALGQPLSAVVLGYLLSQPFPTAAIVGPRTPQQLQDSLQNAGLRLSAQQLAFLEGQARE